MIQSQVSESAALGSCCFTGGLRWRCFDYQVDKAGMRGVSNILFPDASSKKPPLFEAGGFLLFDLKRAS